VRRPVPYSPPRRCCHSRGAPRPRCTTWWGTPASSCSNRPLSLGGSARSAADTAPEAQYLLNHHTTKRAGWGTRRTRGAAIRRTAPMAAGQLSNHRAASTTPRGRGLAGLGARARMSRLPVRQHRARPARGVERGDAARRPRGGDLGQAQGGKKRRSGASHRSEVASDGSGRCTRLRGRSWRSDRRRSVGTARRLTTPTATRSRSSRLPAQGWPRQRGPFCDKLSQPCGRDPCLLLIATCPMFRRTRWRPWDRMSRRALNRVAHRRARAGIGLAPAPPRWLPAGTADCSPGKVPG
jgi:hypothetical protein